MNIKYADFFEIFSKMECALKETGYLKMGRSGNAEVDWDKYAKQVNCVIRSENREFEKAITYIKERPPKKQVVENGKAVFVDASIGSEDTSFQYYITAIKRVRNNLFHGGKFRNTDEDLDKQRNEDLVIHSLVILKESLKYESQVKDFFDNILW